MIKFLSKIYLTGNAKTLPRRAALPACRPSVKQAPCLRLPVLGGGFFSVLNYTKGPPPRCKPPDSPPKGGKFGALTTGGGASDFSFFPELNCASVSVAAFHHRLIGTSAATAALRRSAAVPVSVPCDPLIFCDCDEGRCLPQVIRCEGCCRPARPARRLPCPGPLERCCARVVHFWLLIRLRCE